MYYTSNYRNTIKLEDLRKEGIVTFPHGYALMHWHVMVVCIDQED
jgi:hypothetical protein